jgi:hypothetical protein
MERLSAVSPKSRAAFAVLAEAAVARVQVGNPISVLAGFTLSALSFFAAVIEPSDDEGRWIRGKVDVARGVDRMTDRHRAVRVVRSAQRRPGDPRPAAADSAT